MLKDFPPAHQLLRRRTAAERVCRGPGADEPETLQPDGGIQGGPRRVRPGRGAYSVGGADSRARDCFAFRDPFGIKPLVFSRQGDESAFASESVAFDRLGFHGFTDVKPGEAIFVDFKGKVHRSQVRPGTPRALHLRVRVLRPTRFGYRRHRSLPGSAATRRTPCGRGRTPGPEARCHRFRSLTLLAPRPAHSLRRSASSCAKA